MPRIVVWLEITERAVARAAKRSIGRGTLALALGFAGILATRCLWILGLKGSYEDFLWCLGGG